MDSTAVVFDISSDEECWGEIRSGGGTDGGGDGYDWISEFFENELEESDDVVLVGEVVLTPKKKPKSSNIAENPWAKDFEDDECVILDGDPDKPVLIEKDTACDSDDLLIVGAKGQIACRDYPHPRHLCANFPFTSTPHDRHCHLCHCYVCDSLAPCVQWGNATSSIDHCHATDKHEYWKLQRRNLKQGGNIPPPVPKFPVMSVPTDPLQNTPAAPLPPQSVVQTKYVAHHQVSRPTTIRACSTSASSLIPNPTNQGRIHQPPFVNSRNKFLPHLISQQLPGIVRRDRSHSMGNLGAQFTNSHAIFKRAGSVGAASTTYRAGYNHATQYIKNPSPMAASNNIFYSRRRDFSNGMRSNTNVPRAPSLQNNDSRFGNSLPSHHRVSSHPSRGGVIGNPAPSQSAVSSNLNTGSSFANTVPYPQASSQPTMGSSLEYPPTQPHEISQPNMACSYVNPEFSQHQGYSQPIPVSNDYHNGAQNPLDPRFSDFHPTWVNPTGESDQQSLADNSHIQSAGVTEFSPQIPLSINVASPDFNYDSWMLDNQPVSGALEVPDPSVLDIYSSNVLLPSGLDVYSPKVPVPSGLDVYSPESVHIGSNFFCDF